MNPVVAAHCMKLEELRPRFQVTSGALRSAATGQFDPGRSDLDFLVEFRSLAPAQHVDAYFSLLLALENLCQRKIDLVEEGTSGNPYFFCTVAHARALPYAA